MTFTDNHDKNAWEGTQYSNFGDGLKAAMVLASMVNGMPLVYSGQEAGLNRSLAFFEKDMIDWKEHPNAEIYKKLFALKHNNQALWNGEWGGEMVRVYSDKMEQVISFFREKNGDKVLPVINFSDKPVSVLLDTRYFSGTYNELFSGKEYNSGDKLSLELKPWEYFVFYQENTENK
jgi:glycosidase